MKKLSRRAFFFGIGKAAAAVAVAPVALAAVDSFDDAVAKSLLEYSPLPPSLVNKQLRAVMADLATVEKRFQKKTPHEKAKAPPEAQAAQIVLRRHPKWQAMSAASQSSAMSRPQ